MTEPSKLAAFVFPELPKSRLDMQWARICERRPAERKRVRAAIPASFVLVAACAIGVVWWPRDLQSGESVWEGSVVASDDAPVEMRLAEGTRIQVEPRSEVKLLHSSSSAVQVRLAHGSARFDVEKKRTRRFSVDLGEVEVVVTGTQFRVLRKATASGERIQVAVDEGSVEVHRGDDGVVLLQAGENWSTVSSREAVRPAHVETQLDEAEPVEEPESEAIAAPEETSEREPSSDEDLEANERDPEGASRDAARQQRKRRARAAVDAGELFDHANLARRAGRLDDAAELYSDLVARYPRDRRASLAAFELGRLRMDSLRDTRGAVQALEKALKLDGQGAFAEDALARLVLAQEARGDASACQRAQSRYLARYPEGVHAQNVAERCGSR